jgi:hypothetical protein
MIGLPRSLWYNRKRSFASFWSSPITSGPPHKTDISEVDRHVSKVSRVDGSGLERHRVGRCCHVFGLLGAVHMTAGHNALRGSGPGLPTRVAMSRPVISSSAGLSCRLRKFKCRGQSLGPLLSFEPDPRFVECRFCFLRSPRCMAQKGHLAADNESWQSLGSQRQEQAKNPLQRSCVWPSN